MQTRLIARLARKLRKTHRLTKSWRMTAQICHVLTPNGQLNPGLARHIAVDHWQPSDETIMRLASDGAIIIPCRKRRVQDLFDMSTDELRATLLNRQPMPDCDPLIPVDLRHQPIEVS